LIKTKKLVLHRPHPIKQAQSPSWTCAHC